MSKRKRITRIKPFIAEERRTQRFAEDFMDCLCAPPRPPLLCGE